MTTAQACVGQHRPGKWICALSMCWDSLKTLRASLWYKRNWSFYLRGDFSVTPPTSAQIHSPGTSIHIPTHRVWCYRFFVAPKTSSVHLHILNYVSKETRFAVSPSLASLTLNLQANTLSITCFMLDVDGITMNPAPKWYWERRAVI